MGRHGYEAPKTFSRFPRSAYRMHAPEEVRSSKIVGVFGMAVIAGAIFVGIAAMNPIPAAVIIVIFGLPLGIAQAIISERADERIYQAEWEKISRPTYSMGDYNVVVEHSTMGDLNYEVRNSNPSSKMKRG